MKNETTQAQAASLPQAKIWTFNFSQVKLYAFTAIFVALSVATPYFLHQLSIGGRVVLPLYFFVLISGYKFGWQAGLLTALFSPIISHLISGMPQGLILTLVVIKSISLGIAAGLISAKIKKISLGGIFLSLLIYQIIGLIAEFLLSGQINLFISDMTVGYPGLLLQLFGGYLGLRFMGKY